MMTRTVAQGITAGGGSIETYRIEAFTAEAHQALVGRFNIERDAEYTEVVERAQAVTEAGRELRVFTERSADAASRADHFDHPVAPVGGNELEDETAGVR